MSFSLWSSDNMLTVCPFSIGTNSLVTYGDISEEGFTINPATGVITTTKALDRETQEYYTVTGIVL